MLRVTQQDNAAAAKKYYSKADYYTEGQEIVGQWGGRGAERLGLNGVVDKDSFDRLCDNLDPQNGGKLTVRTRSDRTVGYDFTFSVPKSVSLLYAMTGDRDLLDAFRAAVDETMRDIESEMKTRVRKKGRDEDRLTGNMVWAEFIHTTSRPVDGVPDPQLHAHCFAFNSTWDDKEQQWKAGQFRGLKADAPYFQAAFRVRLANKLQDLGFGITRKRDDFEISGVAPATIKRFSRRTEEIEKVAAERGITDPKRKGELGAETREKKSQEMSWNQLRKEWDSRLTDSERQALTTAARRSAPFARAEGGEKTAADHAIDHSFQREAVVSERALMTEALKRGVGSVNVEGVKRELDGRHLIRGQRAGRAVVTTQEMAAAEAKVITFARDGRGRFRPLGDPGRPVSRDWLNAGQKAAVRHVLASRDRVTIIRGAAGTGKTTLEAELGEALGAVGMPVVALAPTTGAADELKTESGFANADTLARFLVDERMQAASRGGVVVVDEAGLIGTRDMLRLFDAAKNVDARIVLVGDRFQNRPVSAGEPLKLLEERAGLPVAQVTEILRQSGDYKRATQALNAGRTAEGFAELNRLGWIREVPDAERYQDLAAAYLAATAEKKRNGDYKTAIVVSPTHAEGGRITGAIREALKEKGKLKKERILDVWLPAHLTNPQKADATNYDVGDLVQFHQNAPGHPKGSRLVVAEEAKLPLGSTDRFEVYRPARLALAVGDRVRVTVNGKTKDGKHKLRNGALFTVQGWTPQGDVIVDHNWVIAKTWGHVTSGYAVTSEASQGRTVNKVFVGISSQSLPAANQRRFLVPATRGKEQMVLFTDDKKELLRAIQRADQPLSATELAESQRRKGPLPRRLGRHLAFLGRLTAFARTHDGRDRPAQHEQEHAYGR
jgi:conjugative relaxase-like TrwC/TraI family protein